MIRPISAHTIPFRKYTHLPPEELKELLKKYRVLGLRQLIWESGKLLLIPKNET